MAIWQISGCTVQRRTENVLRLQKCHTCSAFNDVIRILAGSKEIAIYAHAQTKMA